VISVVSRLISAVGPPMYQVIFDKMSQREFIRVLFGLVKLLELQPLLLSCLHVGSLHTSSLGHLPSLKVLKLKSMAAICPGVNSYKQQSSA
jgi:hypothetical protein